MHGVKIFAGKAFGEYMKVCVIGTRGFPLVEGGVEKHCESLYPLLEEDISIIVYRRKPYVKTNTQYGNIRFIDLPSTKIKGLETLLHSLLATMNALVLCPEVVHYHNIGPALFSPLLKLRKISVILTYHSPNYEHGKWGKLAKQVLRFSEKIALKYSDKVIFVNRFQMKKYPSDIQKKSVYIPNGIQDAVISNNKNFLDKIGVEPGKYILSIGRITPEKGFDTLIKGFKLANQGGYKLVIAGGVEFEKGYMNELKSLSENEQVIFTGYVHGDDLAQLYTNAALYVLASYNEGFPLVLLEAMSYKLMVLVSDIPATHLVQIDEDDYFACGDYEMLGRKIGEKLKKPQAVEYELKAYDWNYVAAQVSGIFNDVVKKNRQDGVSVGGSR